MNSVLCNLPDRDYPYEIHRGEESRIIYVIYFKVIGALFLQTYFVYVEALSSRKLLSLKEIVVSVEVSLGKKLFQY